MRFLPVVLFAALFGAYFVWMGKKKAAMQGQALVGMRRLLEETGFRVAAIHQAPIEEHVRVAIAALGTMGGSEGQEWIRVCSGVRVHHFFRAVYEDQRNLFWCKWYASFQHPPRVALQIIERKLVGTMASVGNFLENRSYAWEQELPHPVSSGDRDLDARFLFFGHHPDAVRAVLQTQGLRDLLLATSQVDLRVSAEGVCFTDPFRENLKAAFGGGAGALMSGYDMEALTLSQIPVHERISSVVATLARACA
jgi:hypothetical protein